MARAQIRTNVLSDGSKTFDVILTEDDGEREVQIELNPIDADYARELMEALGSANVELDWDGVRQDFRMSAVHPIFDGACRAISGDVTREAANSPAGLGCYMVRIIQAGVVVHQFEAMSTSSSRCVDQHLGLVPEGAKLDVMTIAAWQEKCRTDRAMREELDQNIRHAQQLGMLR